MFVTATTVIYQLSSHKMICAVLHVRFIALTPRFKLDSFYVDIFSYKKRSIKMLRVST